MAVVALTGCGQLAPRYSFSPANVQLLKESGSGKVRLGPFSAAQGAGAMSSINVRANPLSSPYGDYPTYLREALRQELTEANRLAPDAAVELSGVMIRNDLTAGLATGDGVLEARIIVRRGETTLYDRVLTATTSWDSTYAGMVAIPRAFAAYPDLVSAFVATLLRDQAFLSAIR